MLTFYLKSVITGQDYDPLTMGAFTGALLGGLLAMFKKLAASLKVMRRLKRHRQRGFNKYGY